MLKIYIALSDVEVFFKRFYFNMGKQVPDFPGIIHYGLGGMAGDRGPLHKVPSLPIHCPVEVSVTSIKEPMFSLYEKKY